MRSMVEGFSIQQQEAPPPHFVRSPSPRNRGEDVQVQAGSSSRWTTFSASVPFSSARWSNAAS